MIPGIAPAISKKKAAGPGGGYSFTMTAGDSGVGFYGYDDGETIGVGPFGAKDKEPVPGVVLVVCISDNSTLFAIGFYGDALSLVSGKDVWINGIPLGVSAEWTLSGGFTENIVSSAIIFNPSQQYFIEIK